MTAERIGLMTLATTAIAFGAHSAVDWTWFVPGTAATGLLCAAWVAAYGPPAAPHAGADAAAPRWRAARGRIAAAVAVLLVGLAGAWAVWQPQRAVHAEDRALDALAAGNLAQAQADAEDAQRIDPLSIDPLLTLAAIESAAHRPAAARATLQRLGQFELAQGHAHRALELLGAAVYLDPRNPAGQFAYTQAQQAAQNSAVP
jgi:tetratricopeptide (TPR) repeat protein